MKILVIGLNYAPEETGNAPYTAGLAEHLARQGHRVTVVAGLPHYPAWRVFDGYRRRAWLREERNGVDVRRRWHYVPGRQSALRRALFEGSFFLTGLSALTLQRPDAVIGVVPSLSGGLLARVVARRFGAPYGLIFQDLVGQSAEQSGVSGGGAVAGAVRAAESWAARGAAAIGVIAEGFRPYLESLRVDASRIRRVRNWTHVQAPALGRAAVRGRLGLPQDAIVCLHAGNMGHKQGLENVLDCARLANGSAQDLLFVLVGDGNQRPHLEEMATHYGLVNLRFLPLQPPGLFPSVISAADILLVNQRGSVREMSLPSKLTSYFVAGRPVVSAVEPTSETAQEVRASGGGLVVDADDPEALLGAIRTLSDDEALRAKLGRAGSEWAAARLCRAAILEGYEKLLASVVAEGNGAASIESERRVSVKP